MGGPDGDEMFACGHNYNITHWVVSIQLRVLFVASNPVDTKTQKLTGFITSSVLNTIDT